MLLFDFDPMFTAGTATYTHTLARERIHYCTGTRSLFYTGKSRIVPNTKMYARSHAAEKANFYIRPIYGQNSMGGGALAGLPKSMVYTHAHIQKRVRSDRIVLRSRLYTKQAAAAILELYDAKSHENTESDTESRRLQKLGFNK